MPQIILGPDMGGKLDGSVKKAAYGFLEKLTKDDTAPGLHIEPIVGSADPRVRTGRVTDSWRAVLVKITGNGGATHYVYLGTLPHDEAIKRAKTTSLRINPVNGIAELVHAEPVPAAASVPAPIPEPAPAPVPAPAPATAPTPLLTAHDITAGQLTELGLDTDFAQRALAATGEDALLAVAETAPARWQADVVLDLATGASVDEVQEKLALTTARTPAADSSDDSQLLDALHTSAAGLEFAFIKDNADLRAAIEDPDFNRWRVFLHPEQKRYAFGSWKGSYRVTGGAGTGKTVILAHRARFLARLDPHTRIVLTTYSRTLADALERTMRTLDPSLNLLSGDELGKPGIYIASVDSLAYRLAASAQRQIEDHALQDNPIHRVLGARSNHIRTNSTDELWQQAAQTAASAGLAPDLANPVFLAAEYAYVVVPNLVTERDQYLRVPRPGRGVRLGRRERIAVWEAFTQYRASASAYGSTDFDEKAMIAAEYVRAAAPAGLADHVLVDEAQDLTPAKLHLVRALVPAGPDDLFLAEDSQQRIYGEKVVLSRYGISIRGRSRRLTLNYRTTAENLHYALQILEGGDWTDMDDNAVSNLGYRSARSGPAPRLEALDSVTALNEALAERVRGWLDEGTDPNTIGILCVTRRRAEDAVRILADHNIEAQDLGSDDTPKPGRVLAMTMHRSKGMEFTKVVLFDVSQDADKWLLGQQTVPEPERADRALRARSLLYVAATRARDELVVMWRGAPSALME